MIGVYMIINPANAKYVGSSINIERRIKQYKYLRIREKHKIRNSINKYSYKNHRFIILELCDKDNLLQRERYWCIRHNVLHRYNLNLKIPLKGDKIKSFSQETLSKMSKIHKGKKLSQQQKDRLSISIKGRKQSPEHIKKRIKYGKDNPAYSKAYFKGRKHTEETRKIISDKIKGTQSLGKNNKAKKVINTETGKIYGCAKEVSILLNMNYSTLRAMLQNKNPNKTKYKYYETTSANSI